MSLILKGIDLPKDAEYFSIVFYKKKSYRKEKIMDISEAIQIPKGHGRLIDADLLKDTIRDYVPAYTIGVKIPTFGDTQIMSAIDVMPTILDKERE